MIDGRLARFGIVTALTACLFEVGLASGPKTTTVGQFIDRLAIPVKAAPAAAGPTQVTPSTPARPASWADLDMNAPLTFGVATRLATDLGVPALPPANPGAVVSVLQADAIASFILASRGAGNVALAADGLPDQCLSSINRGHCVDCCKEATGQGGQFCGRFCHQNVPPPPSPGEPQP